MKKPIIYILLISLWMGFNSCERDITVEFSDYTPKIVVEGSIFEDEYPIVILTRSASYFDTLNTSEMDTVQIFGMPVVVPAYLYEMIITDALVTVNNGETTDTLSLSFDPYVFPFVQYRGSKFKGEVGKTYVLTVEADSQYITAVTTLTTAVPIDSIWFEPINKDLDSLGLIHANFLDPKEELNYYRIFSKTEGRDSFFVHPWYSIFDDRQFSLIDTIEFRLFHGSNGLDSIEDPYRSLFKIGEKVKIRFCTMDYDHFKFWESYQQVAGGGGNPFAAPTEIKTNIEGGLGVWGGYGVTEIEYLVTPPDTIHASNSKMSISLGN